MKRDQNKFLDPSEIWLRQTLEDYQPEVPSDAWQRLAPHLLIRKRRYPVVFWYLKASTVASILTCLCCLKHTITPISSTSFPQKEKSAITTLANILPEDSKHHENSINPSQTKALFLLPHHKAKYSNHGPKNILHTEGLVNASRETSTDSTLVYGIRQTTGIKRLLNSSPPLLLLSKQPFPNFSHFKFTQPTKITQNKRLKLGIETASIIVFDKHESKMTTGLVFHEMHSRPNKGLLVGILSRYTLHQNWRIMLGIQYIQQKQASEHQATLRLMDGVCLNPNSPDLKEYEFQYAVISNGRPSNLTIRLQQEEIGSTMPIDEPFTIQMQTLRHSSILRFPLTIERQFKINHWKYFIRGGGVFDFSIKNTFQVTHFSEACQDLCFHSDHSLDIKSSSPTSRTDRILLGTGVERTIFKHTALRLEAFMLGKKNNLQGGLTIGLLFSN